MGLIVSGGGGASAAKVLYDLIWDPNGPQSHVTGNVSVSWLPRAGPLFVGTAQGTGAPTILANVGIMFPMASGAAFTSMQASQAGTQGPFSVPLARSPTIPKLWPRCEYLYECTTGIGAARGTADIAIGFLSGANVAPGQNAIGIFWSSRVGDNGGRWTPRSKRTSGAADFIDGADSGVACDATTRKLAVRFLDLPVPRVEFSIDDITRFAMVAPSLPTAIFGATTNFQPFISLSNPAGTDIRTFALRYVVREL